MQMYRHTPSEFFIIASKPRPSLAINLGYIIDIQAELINYENRHHSSDRSRPCRFRRRCTRAHTGMVSNPPAWYAA